MDALDREILGELVRDARLSYRDLGARVGLSANAAADRVRRLRRQGVITGFTATVDPGAAGRRLHALIEVNMGPGHTNDSFEAAVSKLEAVIDADHVTGRFDYQLRVACRDTAELDRLLRQLKTQLGVVETETRVVLRRAIARYAHPIGSPPLVVGADTISTRAGSSPRLVTVRRGSGARRA